MRRSLLLSVATGSLIAAALQVKSPAEASQAASGAKASDRRVEDIYVARSKRVSRFVTATDFCAEARTGFPDAAFDDQYTFHSPAVRGSDGLVTDTTSRRSVAFMGAWVPNRVRLMASTPRARLTPSPSRGAVNAVR